MLNINNLNNLVFYFEFFNNYLNNLNTYELSIYDYFFYNKFFK